MNSSYLSSPLLGRKGGKTGGDGAEVEVGGGGEDPESGQQDFFYPCKYIFAPISVVF